MKGLRAKVKQVRKEKSDEFRKELIETELAELAKYGVSGDEVHVIHGRLIMSVRGLIKLSESPEYLAYLEKESLALDFHKDFFKEQLDSRIVRAKQKMEERIKEREERVNKDNNNI